MYFTFLGLLFVGYTDGTECPDFWTSFEGSCYLFPDHHRSSFTEAENYCRQHHNSHLAHIDTEAENTFVKTYLTKFKALRFANQNHKMTSFRQVFLDNGSNILEKEIGPSRDEPHWMGLTDEDIEGMYKWFDTDSLPDYTNWAPGQPDSAIGGNEDCVIFYDDDGYQWHDVPCTEHHDPVCEFKTEPVSGNMEIIGK